MIDVFLHNHNASLHATPQNLSYLSPINASPFTVQNSNIDLSFFDAMSTHSNIVSLNSTINIDSCIDEIFENFDHVFFVDGSVKPDGKVGVAIFSPTLNLNLQLKLPDNLQIYYVEGFAILQALTYAKNHSLFNFCIISDNIKIIQDLLNYSFDLSPHPFLLHSIITLVPSSGSSHVRIKWLPSSSNCTFLETVDSLASKAVSLPHITEIGWTWHELVHLTDNWVWRLWLEKWGSTPYGSYQATYAPTSNQSIFFKSRRSEIIAHRIKFLHSQLNAGLFKIGKHPDGICSTCGVSESNHHFLFDCVSTVDLRKDIRSLGVVSPGSWNYRGLTSNNRVMDIIIKYINSKNINF